MVLLTCAGTLHLLRLSAPPRHGMGPSQTRSPVKHISTYLDVVNGVPVRCAISHQGADQINPSLFNLRRAFLASSERGERLMSSSSTCRPKSRAWWVCSAK